MEQLRRPVPPCLLHGHLPALLHGGDVGRQGALLRAPGRVPGPDGLDDAGRGVAGPHGQRRLRPRHRLLQRDRGDAGDLPHRRRPRHCRHRAQGRRRSGLAGGPAGRIVTWSHPRRLHQLGPVRHGTHRRRPGRLGVPAAVAGRGAARPRGGDEVLPADVLRRAVLAVPARGEAARVLQGTRRRADRLAGDQRPGRVDRHLRLGRVLRVQPVPRR